MALTEGPYMLALYGSRARGDDDDLSDIDMLHLADKPNKISAGEMDPRLCFSHYSWKEFEAMHRYGSLFLWHLKTQSRPVKYNAKGFSRYVRLMDTLPEYQRASRDVESFSQSLIDIRQALESGDTAIEFELSSLATTLRHSTILGCYLLGKPEFGRYAAVKSFCEIIGLPVQITTGFVDLYQFRMAIERKGAMPHIDSLEKYAENWLLWSTDVVEEVVGCSRRSNR
jgi:hypothetical protein